MKRILDNPKFLDDYGFEYINLDKLKINLLYKNKYGASEGIIISNIQKPDKYGYSEIELRREDIVKLIDTFTRILNKEECELKPVFKIK